MRTSPLLCLVLGAWLGGSAVVFGVVVFNFSGIRLLADRNPKLAARLGFDPSDEAAKKSSLIWVHASELNRFYFDAWGRAQLFIGGVALAAAVLRRQGRPITVCLLLSLLSVGYHHFVLEPEIVAVGRRLDFEPRDPPPAELATFGRLHAKSLAVEGARMACLLAAAILAAARRERAAAGDH
jgi:hypothetical protein